MKEKYQASGIRILVSCLIVTVVVLFAVTHTNKSQKSDIKKINDSQYEIGKIYLDKISREIKFNCTVLKNKSRAQFLVYLEGYKWLKEECALLSDAKLSDLQTAISFLDWKLWDELWAKKTNVNSKIKIYIEYRGKNIEAYELIHTEKNIDIRYIIFFGSPYFDPVVLNDSPTINCEKCSFYDLEKKSLKEQFIRENNRSGYELNENNMPVVRTNIKVIIKIL